MSELIDVLNHKVVRAGIYSIHVALIRTEDGFRINQDVFRTFQPDCTWFSEYMNCEGEWMAKEMFKEYDREVADRIISINSQDNPDVIWN